MAVTEKVLIWVQQRGAKQTSMAMKGLAVSMAAVGYTAVRVGKNLTEAADSYTNLTNRTKVFAKSQESAAYRMQETIRIARDTHQTIDSISSIVQRVSLAQASTGMGDEQLVKVAENLSKAAMLSGATGQEAEGALRQFTQGLAANRLAGQELNSVLEQTPLVAQMIADEMEVPIGSLRGLAEQGKLTSEFMIQVFGKDSEKLNKMMAGWDWPIEAMFTDLRREWKLGMGKFLKDSGLEGAFKEKLVGIKETFQEMMTALSDPTLMGNVVAAFKAVGGALAAVGAAAAVAGIGFLIVSAPIATMVVAAIALAGAMAALWDVEITLGEHTGTLGDAFSAAWGQVKKFTSYIGDVLVKVALNAVAVLGTLGETVWNALSGNWGELGFEGIKKSFEANQGYWKTQGEGIANGLASGLGSNVTGIVGDFAGATADDIANVMTAAFGDIDFDMANIMFGEDFMSSSKAKFDALAAQHKASINAKPADGNSVTATHDLKAEALIGRVTEVKGLTKQFLDAQAAMKKMELSMEQLGEKSVYTEVMHNEMVLYLDDMELAIQKATSLAALGAEGGVLGTFGATIASQLEEAADAGKAFGTILAAGFEGATDALVDFVNTGEMNFKAFASSMLKMISQIIMKLMIMKMLEGIAGGGGFGSGMATDILGAMGHRATGGPVGAGQPYLVGEKGPELFVPPSGGSIKNAKATAGMQQQAPQVTIINSDDPASIPAAMDTEAGQDVILNIIQRNPEVLRPLG